MTFGHILNHYRDIDTNVLQILAVAIMTIVLQKLCLYRQSQQLSSKYYASTAKHLWRTFVTLVVDLGVKGHLVANLGNLASDCPLVANLSKLALEHPLVANSDNLALEHPLVAKLDNLAPEHPLVANLDNLAP